MLSAELSRRTLLHSTAGFSALAALSTVAGIEGAEAAPFRAADGIFGWGSSSLANTAGGSSVLTRIAKGLGRPSWNYARNGQASVHTMVFRSFYAPRMSFPNNRIPSGTSRVQVGITNIPYHYTLDLTGTVNGVYGRMISENGRTYFQRWTAGSAKAVSDNRFIAEAGIWSNPGRHIYWMGKNDLVWSQFSRETAVENLRRAWNMNGSKKWTHNFALGHWVTRLDSAAARRDVAWINKQYVYYFGAKNVLDVQTLLTTEWGLKSGPVRHLNVLSNPTWAQQARNGIVPDALVQSGDPKHLNDYGNAVVAQAAIYKLKQKGW